MRFEYLYTTVKNSWMQTWWGARPQTNTRLAYPLGHRSSIDNSHDSRKVCWMQRSDILMKCIRSRSASIAWCLFPVKSVVLRISNAIQRHTTRTRVRQTTSERATTPFLRQSRPSYTTMCTASRSKRLSAHARLFRSKRKVGGHLR